MTLALPSSSPLCIIAHSLEVSSRVEGSSSHFWFCVVAARGERRCCVICILVLSTSYRRRLRIVDVYLSNVPLDWVSNFGAFLTLNVLYRPSQIQVGFYPERSDAGTSAVQSGPRDWQVSGSDPTRFSLLICCGDSSVQTTPWVHVVFAQGSEGIL